MAAVSSIIYDKLTKKAHHLWKSNVKNFARNSGKCPIINLLAIWLIKIYRKLSGSKIPKKSFYLFCLKGSYSLFSKYLPNTLNILIVKFIQSYSCCATFSKVSKYLLFMERNEMLLDLKISFSFTSSTFRKILNNNQFRENVFFFMFKKKTYPKSPLLQNIWTNYENHVYHIKLKKHFGLKIKKL